MGSEDASSSRTQHANDGASAPGQEEVAVGSSSRTQGGTMSRDGRGMTPGGKKGVTIADTHETSDSTFMPLHQPGAKPSTPGILRMNTPSEANLFAGEAEVGRHLGDDDYMGDMGDIAASTPSRSEVSSRQSSRTVGSKAPSEGGQGRVPSGDSRSSKTSMASVGNMQSIRSDDLATAERVAFAMNQERVLVDNAGGITLSAEALKTMCDNLEANDRVQVLTMGFCNIDDKGMTAIANALTANTTLRTLNLWDNKIGSEGGDELGHALASNSSLLEINLRTNSLGQKGALGIAKGLFKNNVLAVVHLRYNNIGDYGAKAIAATLMNNTTLTEVDVARNRIGFEGAEALMKSMTHNQTLRHLNLQRNGISDQGGLALGIALKVNTSLTHLDVMDCGVGDIGAVSIFESLGGIYYNYARHAEGKVKRRKIPTMNNSIRYLNVGGNDIGLEGGRQVGRALCMNTVLTTLDLAVNRIEDVASAEIAEAIKVNTVLLELSLASNQISAAGGSALGEGLSVNNTLVTFEMQNNKISWLFDTSGITKNLTLRSFKSDLNLLRIDVGVPRLDGHTKDAAMDASMRSDIVTGYRIDVSHAREKSTVDAALEVFGPMSRALLSLHCTGNGIGLEDVADVQETLGVYTAHATSLLDLNLSRNFLRDDHLRCLVLTSLTLLDLSHNQIGNVGAEIVVNGLTKVRGGSKLREIDLTDNYISRMSPNLAYMTVLESVYIEENPIMTIVPLTAAQGGVRAITVWLHRWAVQQLHLTEKAVTTQQTFTKKEIMSIDDAPRARGSTAGSRSSSTLEKRKSVKPVAQLVIPGGGLNSSAMSDVSGPSVRGGGMLQRPRGFASSAPRFSSKSAAQNTPGPIDYSPYAPDGKDMWRSVVSTNEKAFEHGPILSAKKRLGPEQEAAVLEVRKQLIEQSFDGLPAFPRMWQSPRYPTIIEAVKKEQATHGTISFLTESKLPAGHLERYGTESIRREVNRMHPHWNVTTWQVMRALKDNGLIHSDDVAAADRPHYRASKAASDLGSVRKEEPPPKRWYSKTLFTEALSQIASTKDKRKLEGFSQWLLLHVPVASHCKNMELIRGKLGEYDWGEESQRTAAAIVIRNFMVETYMYHFQSKAVFNIEELERDVQRVAKTGGLNRAPDQRSVKAESSKKAYTLFIDQSDGAAMTRASAELEPRPGPLDYNTESYRTIGSDGKGVNMGRPKALNEHYHPPSATPGPQDYPNLPARSKAGPMAWQDAKGKERDPRDDGPGPGVYETPDIFSKHLQTSPPKSLYSRSYFEYQNTFGQGSLGPGPAAYDQSRVVDMRRPQAKDSKSAAGSKTLAGSGSSAKPAMDPVEENGSMKSSSNLARGEKREIRAYALSTHERPPAFSILPKPPPMQHVDPTHKNRITPGPRREAFYTVRNNREVCIEEVTKKSTTRAFSMMGTPLAVPPSNTTPTPDPGTYNIPQFIGGASGGPSWTMGADTLGRSQAEVFHVAAMGRQGPGLGTLIVKPRNEATRVARHHPGADEVVARLDMSTVVRRDSLRASTGGSLSARGASRSSKTLTGTATRTSRMASSGAKTHR